jgi:predicted dinucleotide-binding enzyme
MAGALKSIPDVAILLPIPPNPTYAPMTIVSIAGPMGFRAHDAGPLRNSALLENLAVPWIHLAAVGGAGFCVSDGAAAGGQMMEGQ